MIVSIGVSNRHAHLKKEHLEILFGSDYELSFLREIKQPGQFACQETVTIKTDKSEIGNVRVLGPVRDYTQIEISKTDAYKLGLNPPVRESGNLEGSSPITVIGPKGQLELQEGCIIADRHIHMNPSECQALGLVGVDEVSVQVDGIKGGLLDHVSIRVNDNFCLEMHIDTDDANAHLLSTGDQVTIIKK